MWSWVYIPISVIWFATVQLELCKERDGGLNLTITDPLEQLVLYMYNIPQKCSNT